MEIIKLTSVNKIYRTDEIETQALENVNLSIEKGEFMSVMGPSGCGKSTLLNIIGMLDVPTSGTVHLFLHTLAAPFFLRLFMKRAHHTTPPHPALCTWWTFLNTAGTLTR